MLRQWISDTATSKPLPQATKVKNKQPAPMQITAEQILREANERGDPTDYGIVPVPRQKITDPEELAVYRLRKRKAFEDRLRMNRLAMGSWLKYAQWEESQRDFERARSVYERALDVDYRNPSLWLKYAEMEMRHRHINHARNVWDRAVTIHPRVDQFWFKYSYMEEMLGNVNGARTIFERWMDWQPDDHAWTSYIRMEMRYNMHDRAREVFNRYVECHAMPRSWMKWAKFEERLGETAKARGVFERALEELEEDKYTEEFFIAFATFEERAKESERARVIYKYALDHLPKSQAQELYKKFVSFEKQHGDREGIEDVVVSKKRFQYEEELKDDLYKYDTWFDYCRLEENQGMANVERTRDTYERAIANVPPAAEKRLWTRYIYLWINYALFEEMEAKDMDKARAVLSQALKIVPHQIFTFGKLWNMAAHFEIRRLDVGKARKILGTAIGKAPKDKLFKSYIELELKLGEVDRCRQLYEKYLEWNPANCQAWIAFAELETSLGELDRTRKIYELAINQPLLDMPELLWKAYIDFEIGQEEHDNTRELYARLLDRTKHVKVWISFAQFEAEVGEKERAHAVFDKAHEHFKDVAQKEERMLLLEGWKEHVQNNDEDKLEEVEGKMPKKIKKKRPIQTEDGADAGWEEYYEYIFPEEQSKGPNLKILEMAHKWKRQKTTDDD